MKWYLLLVIKLSLSTIVFAQVPPAAAESSSYINRDTALGSANLQAIRKIHERSGSIITQYGMVGFGPRRGSILFWHIQRVRWGG